MSMVSDQRSMPQQLPTRRNLQGDPDEHTPDNTANERNPTRRLGMTCRFVDEHMELFFMAALGRGRPVGWTKCSRQSEIFHPVEAATMRRDGVIYVLHHIGIPTEQKREGERFAAAVGMYTTDDFSGSIPVQWHRFEADSVLHPLMRSAPHVAYKVDDLEAAIVGHEVILGPYEPIDDYRVAVINNAGMPIELIQTGLSDEEIWGRAKSGQKASLYE